MDIQDFNQPPKPAKKKKKKEKKKEKEYTPQYEGKRAAAEKVQFVAIFLTAFPGSPPIFPK